MMAKRTVASIKHDVRVRDGMACTKCGIPNDEHKAKTGKQLEVHRVEQGSEYSVAPGVCVTLCRQCHDREPRKIRSRAEIARDYVRPEPPPPPTTLAESLAANLRAERARLHISMKRLAAECGLSVATISKYEGGKKLPTLDALYKLASAYGVEAASLVPPNALGRLPKGKKPKPPQ